jgi:hypothetical protein
MYTRLIGDVHAKFYDYQTHSINDFEGPSIQVGDFGIGFAGPYWHEEVAAWQQDNPQHRFIRGNHDNPAKCKTMPGFIADGTVENDVMFVGGAWSIDHAWRTEGTNWWADEECSTQQLYQLIETYSVARPRVMITHDCPATVAHDMFFSTGVVKGPSYQNRTSDWFDRFLGEYRPEFWFFGHWHHSMAYQKGPSSFICLGEFDYIDVDLTNSDQMWDVLADKFIRVG